VRVVHVYKDVFPPVVGGIEKHIDGLRRAMPDVTSDVLVCARAPRTSRRHVDHALDVSVAELGPRPLSLPLAPAFPLWLRRIPADVVHVHMPNPLAEAAVLSAARGRPVVASYHADIGRQARLMPAYTALAGRCLDRAAAVVAGTEALRQGSPLLAPRSDRVRLIRYGVDVERFDPAHVPEARRDELRARFGAPLVVAVARLVYYKGLENLIRAADELDAAVVIAGDGPLASRLREQAAGRANVHLVGLLPESELPALLATADCFVSASTSRAESFGIATLEAQAMGVPAVVTDVGTGTIEAIEPGVSGLVVPPRDPRALAAAIRAILSDRDRAAEMGRAARARVLRDHALRDQAARMRELYEQVLGG
jgi:glycosyltransferase involved in cell wall biosynthesis